MSLDMNNTDLAEARERLSGKVDHVPIGMIPTPFYARLEALSEAYSWQNWGGYIAPANLEAVETEYFAIRNQTTLFDVSPMKKVRVKGPDALAVINRMVTRDMRKIKPGRVAYAMWCDEDGMVIDDGTIFRFAEDDYMICSQDSQFSWMFDVAYGFDVEITNMTKELAALSVQGPTSFSMLSDAGFEVADMKPFDLREVEPGLWISRTGFTGDLGYEIWVQPDAALALWDRLWDAGQIWGVKAVGYSAVDMVRLEAGFVLPWADFTPVQHAMRPTRGRTPFELGFDWLVSFDKPHYNGMRALKEHKEKGPRYRLLALDLEGAKPSQDALVYHKGKKEVGFVTTGIWSPTAKRNIAYAEVQAKYCNDADNADLRVEIYTNKEGKWERTMVKATITDRPFYKVDRARLTPPNPF